MAPRQTPNSYKDPFWSGLAESTEEQLGLPKGLLVSVLTRGERSNADQVSEAGARTPFQIIPATRNAVIKKYGVDAYLSPQMAARTAGLLLKESLDRNQNNITKAIAEYHGGTNPRNWGPRTKSYIQRVSQGVPEARASSPTISEGGRQSTYERALAKKEATAPPQSAIAKIYQAYSSGAMTPEEAAEFESDVKAGNIMLPRGASIRGQQRPQGARATIPVLPKPVLDAYSSGAMTREEMMELESDVASGIAKVPTGFQLKKTKPLGIIGGIKEAITGEERATSTTRELPNWTMMPELNTFSMAGAKTAVGTLLTGPEETVQIIQANFPSVKIQQDEKGNFILQSSIDGKRYAYKPGVQVGDIPRAVGALTAFTPAGGARTILGAGAANAATQAAIEASQAGTGGEFNPGEVALAGGVGAGVQALAGVPAAIRAVRGPSVPTAGAPAAAPVLARAEEIAPAPPPMGAADLNLPPVAEGPPIAPIEPVAPVAPPIEPVAPPIEPVVPGAPIEPPLMTMEELVKTTRTATAKGLGAGKATEELAAQVEIDPAVLESAKRLGIDQYLQPDHLTTNQAFRELTQAAKSVPGSQMRTQEITGLEAVGKRADDLITEVGGLRDLSEMNASVRTNLSETVKKLEDAADVAYKDLRTNIPATTRGPATNVLAFVQKRIDELDGPDNLSALEKAVLGKLSLKTIKDAKGKVTGTRLPTYALIDDVRRDIGAAARQKGEFKDADTGLAKELYKLIDEDQFALANTTGRGEQYRAAKSLVQMRKGFEDDMESLFGLALDQSLVSKLSTATMDLSKGDAEKLAKILKAIPKDMRQMVAGSALNTAFGKATQNGTLNFNTYANWYEGLLKNKQAYTALMSNLSKEARSSLDDLYKVSDNVRKATRERIMTGRIQAVQKEMQGTETVLSNIFEVVKRSAIGVPAEMATSAMGLPGAGLASGLTAALAKGARPEILKAADELIASPEFQRLVLERATLDEPTKATVRRVALSVPFRKFADAVKMPKELSWRERWILKAMQTQSQFDQEEQQ